MCILTDELNHFPTRASTRKKQMYSDKTLELLISNYHNILRLILLRNAFMIIDWLNKYLISVSIF